MSRTILIANDFPPVTSGIATVFYQIWKRLPPDRTSILAPDLEGAGAVDSTVGAPVRRVRLPVGESARDKAFKTVLTLLWCFRLVLTEQPRRFHCGQVFSSGIAGWVVRALFGVPYVVWVYGSETVRLAHSRWAQWLMRSVLDGADHVVTNSDTTTREFREFGVHDDRLLRIYPGVDPRAFAPAARDPEWVRQTGIDGKRVLLTIARLDQRKGHDIVIRAMRHLPDDVVYLIGGTGREEGRLRELAETSGVTDRVRFLGFVPDEDLPAVYNLCDVFVMPNRITSGTALEGDIEGFGITFIEAGACAKPVVGGKSGGAVEAVLDGETGLLVDDPEDEAAVADAVRSLLSDADERLRMGRNARERIEREFDWDLLAKQVEAIL